MGDARKPTEEPQDGEAVTTEATSTAEPDLQALLAQAEAEAAEAEAAAAAARAKVRAMRSEAGKPADAEDEEEEESGGRPQRLLWPPRWSTVAKIAAAVIIVAALAGSGVIVWKHHNASVRNQQAQEFIDTAKDGVIALTSIDFKSVRGQVQHIIDTSTGGFKDDFARRSDDFIKVAEASKAVGKGSVSEAAVEKRASDDEAVVLVVGSEEITNAAGNQQPRTFRFRVTVTRDAGQLKVSKLELVL
jgi:Mce-associated membrane protein